MQALIVLLQPLKLSGIFFENYVDRSLKSCYSIKRRHKRYDHVERKKMKKVLDDRQLRCYSIKVAFERNKRNCSLKTEHKPASKTKSKWIRSSLILK